VKKADMATATQRAEDADAAAGMGEVSLAQKMLSAVSGSVLTSLLGAYILAASSAAYTVHHICFGFTATVEFAE
jgi:hypothetical protein